jgi:glutamine synthetase
LRASIASAGNEHRLGANEAPPAIMSIFLGDTLQKVVDNIIKGVDEPITMDDIIDTGIGRLPNLAKDNTDRNRTSPFAFTGDRFEFRAVGSSANISSPLTVINTAVADALTTIYNDIEDCFGENVEPPRSLNSSILEVLAKHLNSSKSILFNGDNYSNEWVEEAKSRGLSNIPSTPEALCHYLSDKSIELFEDNEVLNKAELESRYNVKLDIYIKSIEIECKAMVQMVKTQVLPAGYLYLDMLKNAYAHSRDMNPASAMFRLLADIVNHVESLQELLDKVYGNDAKKAEDMYTTWKLKICQLRFHVDKLESEVSFKLWDIPKYHEMLFV